MTAAERLKAAVREIIDPQKMIAFTNGGGPGITPSDFVILRRSFESANVVGLSVAPKIKSGAEQDILSLRFYVVKKQPAHLLDFPIPSTITLSTGETFSTDVVQIGELSPQAASIHTPERERRLLPGLSIGHPRITAGTLGCIVERRAALGEYYVLSNYHVLGDDGAAHFGSPIIHPASADGGVSPDDDVATLTHAAPFHFDGVPCRVDAALGLISEGNAWHNHWQQDGNTIEVLGRTRPAVKSERVHKIGRTSGYTTGLVLDPNVEAFKVKHKEPGGDIRKPVVFIDQVLCTKYADGGDSGAIVFGDDGYVLGLHMSGNEEVSVFNKISNVIQELDIVISPQRPSIQDSGIAQGTQLD